MAERRRQVRGFKRVRSNKCYRRHKVPDRKQDETAFPYHQELESSLYDLSAPLQDPKVPKMRSDWLQDSLQILLEPEEVGGVWEEEQLLRDQREAVMDLPLSPFAADNSLEVMNYQEGGEGEEGWKRNDALTSMAGGLQAVSREKGGFGFRFGRKRRLEKKRRDGGVAEGVGKQRTRESRKRGFVTEVWD
ncbi:hypothetical protein CCH79_00014121 [Gambusia affinis]|uniref:Uncharacterized protein n=1 Tax=Gambusia affinis TaxID=33528 RepID=A0A315WC35_GAMAF|nr:hypothetical protein CCH79_00014121 [Gambusia affinis]